MSEPNKLTEQGISNFERFVVAPLDELWTHVVEHAPNIASAIVVLLSMWLVAKLVRGLVARALGFTRLDRALAETRIASVLRAFDDDVTPSKALSVLAYFAMLILAWMTAADIVGLTAVRVTLQAVLGYLPSLVSALLVLTIGGYLAGLARRAVAAVFVEVHNPYARLLESLTEFILLVIVCTLAVNVLGVDMTIITQNLTILTAVIAVTIAFLFGWSMRDPASEIIANYYLRRMVGVGDQVQIDEDAGTVAAFTALGIQVRDEAGRDHFIVARDAIPTLKRTSRATPASLAKLHSQASK
jgi:hypothetical protein